MTGIETLQVGRVDRVIQPVGIRPYGFILDSAGKRFFFRKTDCRGEVMPKLFEAVQFFVVKENDPGKNDRAIDVRAAVELVAPA